MNTKKILLTSAIATTMLISGIAMPATYANTKDAKIDGKEKVISYESSSNTMSILLEKGKNTSDTRKLSEKDLRDLVEKKFTDTKVKEIKSKTGDNVGTGAVVTLDNEKNFTVVLYGDANKDGKVNLMDATLVAQAAWKEATLDDTATKAARVTKSSKDGITLMDATFIANLAWNQLADYDYASFEKNILPADVEVVDVSKIIEDNLNSVSTLMNEYGELSFDKASKTVKFELNGESCTVENVLTKMKEDTFKKLVETILKDEIIKDLETITLKYDKLSYEFDLKDADSLKKIEELIKTELDKHKEKFNTYKNKNICDFCKDNCIEAEVKIKLSGKKVVFGDDTDEVTYKVCFDTCKD